MWNLKQHQRGKIYIFKQLTSANMVICREQLALLGKPPFQQKQVYRRAAQTGPIKIPAEYSGPTLLALSESCFLGSMIM